MSTKEMEDLYRPAMDFLIRYSFQILGALVLLAVGWFLARKLSNLVVRVCERRNLDPMLSRFLGSAAKITLLVFIFIMALGKFGITIGPLVAALGALTLGASFAVQGILSNYGAGLVIIVTRPFTLGHTIEVGGVRGVVEDTSLGSTILTNEEGERILIPNKHIVGEILTNSGQNSLAECTVGISYGDDPAKALSVIEKVLGEVPDVAEEPEAHTGVHEFAESSVVLKARFWAPTKKFHQTRFSVNLKIFQALSENGFTIPFPQRDVYLKEPAPGNTGKAR